MAGYCFGGGVWGVGGGEVIGGNGGVGEEDCFWGVGFEWWCCLKGGGGVRWWTWPRRFM